MTSKSEDPIPPLQPSVREPFTVVAIAWLQLAAHPATVRRAILTALIVGFVLIVINHGAAIVSGQVTRGRIFQMCLTVLVPYLVSTVSSVATRRELAASRNCDEKVPQRSRNA